MAAHLIWAGVVLVLGVLGYRAVRWRWRDRETFAGGLDGLSHRLDRLQRDYDASTKEAMKIIDTEHSRLVQFDQRLTALAPRVGQLEHELKALSAPPKSVPQVRKV